MSARMRSRAPAFVLASVRAGSVRSDPLHPLDHRRIFDTGDDHYDTAALVTGFDVDPAYMTVGKGREQEW